MTVRRPLVRVGGRDRQLPAGDRLDLPLATSTEPGLMAAADKAEINSLGSASRANFAAMPFVNLMPDAGRFGGKVDTTSLGLSSAFTPSTYFPVYNGAQVASGGKFIHDNTTFGGSAGALTESVVSLLEAMGRSQDARRYGVEFYIASFTAGQQTTVPTTGADGVARYLLLAMQKAIASASAQATFVSWVRVKSGSMHITYPAFVDGVLREAGYVLSGGWHHVRLVAGSAYGYFSNMPYVYAAVGSVVEFAVPAYYSGAVDVGIHQTPLMAINGVGS